MPRANRLTGAEMRSTRPARRVGGALFSVSASSGGTKARFGIVVSKKVATRAVDRNLIKRRSRNVLQKYMQTVPPGAYIFIAKRASSKATFSELERDIAALVRRL